MIRFLTYTLLCLSVSANSFAYDIEGLWALKKSRLNNGDFQKYEQRFQNGLVEYKQCLHNEISRMRVVSDFVNLCQATNTEINDVIHGYANVLRDLSSRWARLVDKTQTQGNQITNQALVDVRNDFILPKLLTSLDAFQSTTSDVIKNESESVIQSIKTTYEKYPKFITNLEPDFKDYLYKVKTMASLAQRRELLSAIKPCINKSQVPIKIEESQTFLQWQQSVAHKCAEALISSFDQSREIETLAVQQLNILWQPKSVQFEINKHAFSEKNSIGANVGGFFVSVLEFFWTIIKWAIAISLIGVGAYYVLKISKEEKTTDDYDNSVVEELVRADNRSYSSNKKGNSSESYTKASSVTPKQRSSRSADSTSRKTSNKSNSSTQESLKDFTMKYPEVSAAYFSKRCASCSYWTGPKQTHKSLPGRIFIDKNSKGDCSFKRNGSQRRNLSPISGQTCKEFNRLTYRG